MRRLRTASGKHEITIYEDLTINGQHEESNSIPSENNFPGARQLKDMTRSDDNNQLYVPQAEYKYDENEMLDKLEALEKLSHSIRSGTPLQRSASQNTVSLQDDDDPFIDDEEKEPEDQDTYRSTLTTEAVDSDPRKTSDAFSEMPPEFEMSGTYTSPVPVEEYLTPVSHKKARYRIDRNQKPFSSPDDGTLDIPSPRTPMSDRQRSSAFRNPSSVRAMQMSSPSPLPFIHSPRAARHRGSVTSRSGTPLHYLRPESRTSRLRDTTPVRSPLSQHSNPQKEYPLVLLHCSIAPISLPYTQTTLQAVLPSFVLEDICLLREKLGLNILDRGVLISHPGEDYELLEERVLESLELKRPRLGKCGHFHGAESDNINGQGAACSEPSAETEATSEQQPDQSYILSATNPQCSTCTRTIANPQCATDASNCAPDEVPRRWDLKVYASNGLLRAGAWGAAWREMEKVDLEIGVWIPDDMRRALEREAEVERERVLVEHAEQVKHGEAAVTSPGIQPPWASAHEPFGMPNVVQRPTGSRHVSTSTEASTAACSRGGDLRPKRSRVNSNPRGDVERMPLSTLLSQYIQRRLRQRPELAALLIVLVLALLFVMAKSAHLPEQVRSHLVNPLDTLTTSWTSEERSNFIMGSTSGTDKARAGGDGTSLRKSHVVISVCTFPYSDASGAGMTALPSEVAGRVLRALASSSAASVALTAPLFASTSPALGTEAATTKVSTKMEPTSTNVEGSQAANVKAEGSPKGGVRELLAAVGQIVVPDDAAGDMIGD